MKLNKSKLSEENKKGVIMDYTKFNKKIEEISLFDNQSIEWYEETLALHPQVRKVTNKGNDETFEILCNNGLLFGMYVEDNSVHWEKLFISYSHDHDDIFMTWKPDALIWLFSKNVDYYELLKFIEVHKGM